MTKKELKPSEEKAAWGIVDPKLDPVSANQRRVNSCCGDMPADECCERCRKLIPAPSAGLSEDVNKRVEEIRERLSKATPGPWAWSVNLKTRYLELCGRGLTILDPRRWGMNSATIRFRNSDNLMVDTRDLLKKVPGREHHASWHQTIAHPDADLIANAPADIAYLLSLLSSKPDPERYAMERVVEAGDNLASWAMCARNDRRIRGDVGDFGEPMVAQTLKWTMELLRLAEVQRDIAARLSALDRARGK